MSNARARQLSKRIEKWQSLLGPLGVTHYTIDAVTLNDAPGGNEDAAACVFPSNLYDRCRFELRNDIVDWAYDNQDFEYLDQTILHEWLHVAFQRWENAVDMVDDKLAPDVSDVWQEALRHAREATIDRIARQLYAAFWSDVVP